MDIVTPFDFVAEFADGKKVAVIGNAPTLEGSGLGAWIDSHDIVVRFNDCRVTGYEKDVGARTEILVCNPYAETRPDRRVGDAVSPRMVVVITPMTRRGVKADFERWIGDYPVLFSYAPDIQIDCGDRRKISLTTGTYGLVLMAKLLKPAAMSVTGFTMFSPGTDFHYWSSVTPSGVKAHTPATEAGIFADILNSFGFPVTITPEIRQIFQSSGRTVGRRVREYGKRSWFGRVR
ncbi:glycosyltransferase family 29 protein [Rhodovulum marinum]|uniref:Glycosyl transferase family 29 (Putative sialyltransferase) n=1 Tax=Rhodovulum marinum TaxID=320662 RepID=A0A4R2PV75_9RHOB|nr:glycosyltransferase family 29 protein [Rhodovulum marinum]TCP39817.1 glycosyl transferase family 29 (putative sialyltransferase) [Rhodovulum marinum]